MLDLEVRSPEVPRLYFDVTVSHSIPGSAARRELSADRDGEVASEAERQKHLRYPKRRVPLKIVPFAFESYGRLGQQGHKYLQSLARTAAGFAEGDAKALASNLLSCWCRRMSVTLHRANAASIRRGVGVSSSEALRLALAAYTGWEG